MYIPPAFRVDDFEKIVAFIEANSFATLVTTDNGIPHATPLPLLFDGEHKVLYGHLARANPQWRHFDDKEVLVMFSGPHAYVSPSWYEQELAVPTWNYTAVHAYGVPQIVEDEDTLTTMLRELIAKNESSRPEPWTGDLPADYWKRMIKGIVGFEIPVSRWEGKWKLNQNRSREDAQSVYAALSQSSQESDRELARVMREEYGFAEQL